MSVAELREGIIAEEMAQAAKRDRSLDAWVIAADHLVGALEVRNALSDQAPPLAELTEALRNELARLCDWLVRLGAREVVPLGEWAGAPEAWSQRASGEPTATQAALDWLLDDHGPIRTAMLMRASWYVVPAEARQRRSLGIMGRTLEWLEEHPGAYLDTTPPELMPGIRALMLAGLLVRDGGWSAPPDWRERLQALRDEEPAEEPEATRG